MVRPPFYTFTKPDAAPTVISSSRRLLSRLRDTMALIGIGFPPPIDGSHFHWTS